jgi:hypothetical protein
VHQVCVHGSSYEYFKDPFVENIITDLFGPPGNEVHEVPTAHDVDGLSPSGNIERVEEQKSLIRVNRWAQQGPVQPMEGNGEGHPDGLRDILSPEGELIFPDMVDGTLGHIEQIVADHGKEAIKGLLISSIPVKVERDGRSRSNDLEDPTILVAVLHLEHGHRDRIVKNIVEHESENHWFQAFVAHVICWQMDARNRPHKKHEELPKDNLHVHIGERNVGLPPLVPREQWVINVAVHEKGWQKPEPRQFFVQMWRNFNHELKIIPLNVIWVIRQRSGEELEILGQIQPRNKYEEAC